MASRGRCASPRAGGKDCEESGGDLEPNLYPVSAAEDGGGSRIAKSTTVTQGRQQRSASRRSRAAPTLTVAPRRPPPKRRLGARRVRRHPPWRLRRPERRSGDGPAGSVLPAAVVLPPEVFYGLAVKVVATDVEVVSTLERWGEPEDRARLRERPPPVSRKDSPVPLESPARPRPPTRGPPSGALAADPALSSAWDPTGGAVGSARGWAAARLRPKVVVWRGLTSQRTDAKIIPSGPLSSPPLSRPLRRYLSTSITALSLCLSLSFYTCTISVCLSRRPCRSVPL